MERKKRGGEDFKCERRSGVREMKRNEGVKEDNDAKSKGGKNC